LPEDRAAEKPVDADRADRADRADGGTPVVRAEPVPPAPAAPDQGALVALVALVVVAAVASDAFAVVPEDRKRALQALAAAPPRRAAPDAIARALTTTCSPGDAARSSFCGVRSAIARSPRSAG
jgi:hypothetical protein